MKKFMFVASILLVSIIASYNFANADQRGYCKVMSELAGFVNEGRYKGVPFAVADGAAGDDDLIRTIVQVVYDMDYFHSEQMQKKQTIAVQNAVYGACIRNMSSNIKVFTL